MLSCLMCTIDKHQPNLLFHRVAGRRVVHWRACGREMIEEARGRWRPSRPTDHARH